MHTNIRTSACTLVSRDSERSDHLIQQYGFQKLQPNRSDDIDNNFQLEVEASEHSRTSDGLRKVENHAVRWSIQVLTKFSIFSNDLRSRNDIRTGPNGFIFAHNLVHTSGLLNLKAYFRSPSHVRDLASQS